MDQIDQTGSNPLMNASNALIGGGTPQFGNPNYRPPGWFLQGNTQKQVNVPQDQPQGKWICTAFHSRGLMTDGDFIRFCDGHAIAIFSNGDFAYWYQKNCDKLVRKAEALGCNFEAYKALAIDRTKELARRSGVKAAIQNYMIFCQGLAGRFRDETIEPFNEKFFISSKWEKFKGTLKIMKTRLFWSQAFDFIGMKVRMLWH